MPETELLQPESSQKSVPHVNKVVSYSAFASLVFLAGVAGFLIGKNFEATLSTGSTTPLPVTQETTQSTTTPGALGLPARYRRTTYSHLATPLNFSFEYPEGWHVRIYFDAIGNRYTNRFAMNPEPIRPTETETPVSGIQVTQTKQQLNKESYVRFIRGDVQGTPTNIEDWTLPGSEDFCYTFSAFDAQSGSTKDITECVINFDEFDQRMLFTITDANYIQEFKHFIESISVND